MRLVVAVVAAKKDEVSVAMPCDLKCCITLSPAVFLTTTHSDWKPTPLTLRLSTPSPV